MTKKIITWVDLQGRYRVTSPAYDDAVHAGKTEDELIDLVINRPVKGLKAHYGLPDDHVFFLVEDADQRERLAECCGGYFRYSAWEMDTDGRPKVDMPKARGIHMDQIRSVRNKQLADLDVPFMRAVETGDTSEQTRIASEKQVLRDIPQTFDLTTDTPEGLKAKWPSELPARE